MEISKAKEGYIFLAVYPVTVSAEYLWLQMKEIQLV